MITCHVRDEIDPAQIEADRIRDGSGCVRRFERTFLRPLLPSSEPPLSDS